MKNRNFYRLLFTLCAIMTVTILRAQIYVQIDAGNNRVLANIDHTIKIKVNNIPAGGVLKITANGQAIKPIDGEATLVFNDSNESYNAVNIDVKVFVNKVQVFKENRQIEYVVFLPASVLEIEGNGYLYRGLESEMHLAVAGFVNSDLIISPSAGLNLRKTGTNTYGAFLSGNYKEVHVGIAVKIEDGRAVNMGRKNFRVVDLPLPVCHLNKSIADIVLTDTALNILTVIPPDLENRVRPKIISFECEIWKGNAATTYISKNLDTISGELLDAIKALQPGDAVFFKKIDFKWIDADALPLISTSFAVSR